MKNGDDDGDCEMIRLNEVHPPPVCIMCRSVDQMLMNGARSGSGTAGEGRYSG